MKILIIEDDALTASGFARSLRDAGFDVEVAANGEIGIARVSTWRPHGLVLDLILPAKNGIEVLNALRADRRFEHLPILVITANFEPTLVDLALEAGATWVHDKAKLTSADLVSLFRGVFHIAPGVDRQQ